MAQQPADPATADRAATPALVALVAAYQTQTTTLRERIERYVRALWGSYSRHDDKARTAFLRDLVPVILGAEQQMSSLTVAFLAHQRQMALGGPFRPVSVDPTKVTGAAVRNGTSPHEVYARPFNVTWTALHDLPREPGSIDKALTAGEQRAVSLATTDLQRAKTLTQQQVTRNDVKVSYTRRILEGTHSCGLCIVASTQRYSRAEVMPMHPGCDCGQEIVYTDKLPSRVIDLSALQDVHDRIEQRFGAASPSGGPIPETTDADGVALLYRDVLITHEHGELGPILAVRGQHFRGLADVA